MALRASSADIERMRHRYAQFDADYIEEELNWVERGAVNPHIKDQGNCSSSWAHAAVAAIEGAHFVRTDEFAALSA